MFENFKTLKTIIDGYKKETIDSYYEIIQNFIDEITHIYSTQNDLIEKKYLNKNSLLDNNEKINDQQQLKSNNIENTPINSPVRNSYKKNSLENNNTNNKDFNLEQNSLISDLSEKSLAISKIYSANSID